MKENQNKAKSVARLTSFTVKQLSELFGKSEDTIRRWKNEGVGKGEDNIKLRAVENEDEFGNRTSRHLVFTRSAVRDFVQANPFLMDDAPQLREFMEQKTKKPEVFALPDSVEDSRCRVAWQDSEDYEPDMEDDIPEIPKSFFGEDEHEEPEDDFLNRVLRTLRGNGKRRARPEPELEFFDEDEDEDEDEEPEPEDDFFSRRRGRRASAEPDWEHIRATETLNYMHILIHERESQCRAELERAHRAEEMLEEKLNGKLPNDGYYMGQLIREKRMELERELNNLRETEMALHQLRFSGEI